MSVFSSVPLGDDFDDKPGALQWLDVAHDHGGWEQPGGCVRLVVHDEANHEAVAYMTPRQAWSLAEALCRASLVAIPKPPEVEP